MEFPESIKENLTYAIPGNKIINMLVSGDDKLKSYNLKKHSVYGIKRYSSRLLLLLYEKENDKIKCKYVIFVVNKLSYLMSKLCRGIFAINYKMSDLIPKLSKSEVKKIIENTNPRDCLSSFTNYRSSDIKPVSNLYSNVRNCLIAIKDIKAYETFVSSNVQKTVNLPGGQSTFERRKTKDNKIDLINVEPPYSTAIRETIEELNIPPEKEFCLELLRSKKGLNYKVNSEFISDIILTNNFNKSDDYIDPIENNLCVFFTEDNERYGRLMSDESSYKERNFYNFNYIGLINIDNFNYKFDSADNVAINIPVEDNIEIESLFLYPINSLLDELPNFSFPIRSEMKTNILDKVMDTDGFIRDSEYDLIGVDCKKEREVHEKDRYYCSRT